MNVEKREKERRTIPGAGGVRVVGPRIVVYGCRVFQGEVWMHPLRVSQRELYLFFLCDSTH